MALPNLIDDDESLLILPTEILETQEDMFYSKDN